ncbi:MAG: YkgJ family cysteine cluster protein [Desulfovibrio sp.]|nr:YkgJ family cysteine cluster protein [Desulfovibrio sp.]
MDRNASGIMDDLTCLERDEKFRFACGPETPCFNRCCAQLNLPLTPYDTLRLARNLGMPASGFLRAFTGMRAEEATGFPMFHLRMIESPEAPCPFVSPAGCSVYEDRPAACRCYPLGRGTRLGREGVVERFFLVSEPHCRGFDSGRSWTAGEWLASQGLEEYNRFNDAYMRLLSLVAAGERPIEPRLRSMAILSLWQPDQFRDFLRKMDIFSKLEPGRHDPAIIDEDSVAGDKACLAFGLDWLELVIFGRCSGLGRRR